MFHPAHPIALSFSLAAAVAATDRSSAAGPSITPVSGRIVVLGDSLAVSPSRSQNFVADVEARLRASHPGWTLSNASYRGDTTSGGMRRFDRALTPDTRILVLELGANDGLRGVDVRTVEQNLAQMIETAQGRGIKVLLCGMEAPPLKGWNYSLAFHGIYPRLAAKYHVPLVPFLLAGVALNPDMNGDDQIHPTPRERARSLTLCGRSSSRCSRSAGVSGYTVPRQRPRITRISADLVV